MVRKKPWPASKRRFASEAVQTARVLVDHLPRLLHRNARERSRDVLAATGERALAVGVVARPEDVVDAEGVALAQSDRVVDEGRVDLAAQINAVLAARDPMLPA